MELERPRITATKVERGAPTVIAEHGNDVIVECPRCQRRFRLAERLSACRCGFRFVLPFDEPDPG